MRYSKLFIRTRKSSPTDEQTVNAQLLVKAGFVNKLMAGVYSYLPFGLRVLNKIEQIVRGEMDAIGGQEVLLPALQPATNWQQTGGWDSIEVLFKIKSRTGKDYALGQSHEEVITPLVKSYVESYRDLPLAVYQIQNKYRDELRAKSGLLRGREFDMKDMYSFHLTQADFLEFYELVKKAYLKIYSRCGLEAKVTEASGGGFSNKISYEFMVLTNAGEDNIIYCPDCNWCINTEIAKVKAGDNCPKCQSGKLKTARAAEAGNVFDLGQKYTKDFDFYVLDKNGKKIYPIMGCYGVGISRMMATIVEKFHDDQGIIWPASVAPFQVHLVSLSGSEKQAEVVYKALVKAGLEVLWDDRDESAGTKFADADLIGVPVRLVVSNKTLRRGSGQVEWKLRSGNKVELISEKEVISRLTA